MDQPILTVQTKEYLYMPIIAERITLEFFRVGGPGKLTFQVVRDSVISFHEGDKVVLRLGAQVLFSGFVFTKRRQAGKLVTVIAYDQIRYLKNRDTLAYEALTAAELVRRVTEDWGLATGEIEETGYLIPGRVENGRPLLDMIQTALDITAKQTGHLFVLYDKAGELHLTHTKNMMLDTLIHEGSIANFDYTSTIDRDSYSAVRLYRPSGAAGETAFYGARRDDLVERWGLLRHFARLEEGADGPETAEAFLWRYGRKARRLRIVDAAGVPAVRGGSMLPVALCLGDISAPAHLVVEQVIHCFSEGRHMMELVLAGGDFTA